ncbi:hypothetical protein BDQ17DRAFT_1386796 [Cyathus striatus]|nr:hypothetical protein BDQ17DRAFT_1386796 [Cyathus striatus]
MVPLAGKPPFATDMPDSYYESDAPVQTRRARQPADDPNKRTSAYDVYNNYMDEKPPAPGSSAPNRQSGVGALGMGLLNMDDSDDSDDESPAVNKQAQLAAALNNKASSGAKSHSPQPIAAPRPGYAAPIAALNLARPEAAATRLPPPAPLQIPTPVSYNSDPFDPSSPAHSRNPFSTPSPSTSPHPLQPPMTPITPVPIMRGNTEETLLPKRGEKGDDFWRRFSMVAKEPLCRRRGELLFTFTTWLRKTRSGSSRLSRWVWIVGILLLICIAGAIGLAVHQQPTAIGGSANEASTGVSSMAVSTAGQASSSSVIKVTPTHTVARREAAPTLLPAVERHRRERERNRSVF